MSNKGNYWGRNTAQKLSDGSEYVTESGCLIWLCAVNDKGYGVLRRNGKNVYAHRASWELEFGMVPGGLCVLHRCDVPSCINPTHLFLGSKADNVQDMHAKKRDRKAAGENAGSHKLTSTDVLAIRTANGTQREIAARYSVSHTQIGSIKRRITWKHI